MTKDQLDHMTMYPDSEHDSLVLRFEQLERILESELTSPGNHYVRRSMRDALDLVKLIRGQVLR